MPSIIHVLHFFIKDSVPCIVIDRFFSRFFSSNFFVNNDTHIFNHLKENARKHPGFITDDPFLEAPFVYIVLARLGVDMMIQVAEIEATA